MEKYIVILRGINVGGHRKILMVDLKKCLLDAGFLRPLTYIQSGNIILESKLPRKEIESSIEKLILDNFGFEVPTLVVSRKDWKDCFENNPYLKSDSTIDAKQLMVSFLQNEPEPDDVKSIDQSIYFPDQFMVIGKCVYLHIQNSYSKSKLTNGLFEKKLKVRATTRNWKTVTKLNELSHDH